MNLYKLAIAIGPLFALTSNHATAYELTTHAKITNAAYLQSKYGSASSGLQRALGIDVWTLPSITKASPFRSTDGFDVYADIRGSSVLPRNATSYEGNIIGKTVESSDERLRVSGWLMRGAIREDDASAFVNRIGRDPKEPQDDPYSNFNRFCSHFFDPLATPSVSFPFGRGLTGFCFNESPVFDNAQWALGSLQPFAPLPAELTTRPNHFSVLDAREAMWRALTLRDRAGNSVDTGIGQYAFGSESMRKVYWATTFRALGDVIHLVQDMAQPQHTRNEGHGSSNTGYEEYIDARAKRDRDFTIDGQTLTASVGQLPDLKYTGYPTPRFNRFSDYWSTRPNGTALGLADYSNRGFFTPASNFPNANYALPSSNISDYTMVRTGAVGFGYSSVYLFGTVNDDVLNSTEGLTMSTLGVLPSTGISRPVLSKRNYDDRAALLIPRAVAYSAGLIDYFFRGQLSVKPTPQGVFAVIDQLPPMSGSSGFTKIKAQLHNSTPDIATPGGLAVQAMTSGILVAVAKFYRDTCFTPGTGGVYLLPPPGAPVCRSANEEILVSTPLRVPADTAIPSGAAPAVTVTFNFDPANPIPVNATDLSLQFVYRGVLGTETDAVVVQTVNVSEPTLITTSNDFDYAWDANNIRYQVPVQDQQTLPAVYFVFASDTVPQSPLSGFSIAAPVAPGKYVGVWTLVDVAAPPSYGSAICAQCPYDLFNVIPRRVETATDGSGTKLVSIPPYQQRGTWQNNGTTFAPAMPPTVCPIGTSLADCLTRNLPAYNPLTPSARVTIDF